MHELFAHQKEAIKFLLSGKTGIISGTEPGGHTTIVVGYGCGMIAHEPGLGKTRTALEVFAGLKAKDPSLMLLVIAPLSLLEAAWRADLEKFFPGRFNLWNVHKGGWLDGPKPDIYAVNYEHFQREENVSRVMGLFRNENLMVVLDESSKIKNHKSLTTKHLLAVRNLFKYRVVMSGTPAPNSEEEYWAQMEFVCPNLLGKSFPKFKRTYFYLRGRGGVALQSEGLSRAAMAELFRRQGAEWCITAEKRKALFDVIGPWIHAAKKDECLDLPEQIDEVRLVQMGPKQRVAYKQMKNLLVAQINGEDVVAQVALTKLMKLREITAGWAYSETGEVLETFENPKINELEEILDELGDRQAIIWCQFKPEIEKICKMIEGRGKTFATLYSETKDREDSINGFIEGRYKYFIAHPRSGGHGLTFVNCSHQIFFSIDFSSEMMIQSKARTHRAGQKNTCVYFYILAEGTVDEDIYKVVNGKITAQDMIYALKKS